MLDKMKELMEMKKKMEEIKRELDAVSLMSEDSLVAVEINGSQEIKKVRIKSELSGLDKTRLEASITETVNRAIRQSQKSAAEKMGGIAG